MAKHEKVKGAHLLLVLLQHGDVVRLAVQRHRDEGLANVLGLVEACVGQVDEGLDEAALHVLYI
jgi:hypothetical protein